MEFRSATSASLRAGAHLRFLIDNPTYSQKLAGRKDTQLILNNGLLSNVAYEVTVLAKSRSGVSLDPATVSVFIPAADTSDVQTTDIDTCCGERGVTGTCRGECNDILFYI